MRKVSIDELPAEHRKLNIQSINSFSKDTVTENVCKFFFNALLCKPSPQLPYPINDYLEKLLSRLDKIFEDETTLIRVLNV